MSNAIRQTIILVGPPGSGKTSAGLILAQYLGFAFADTDQLIEASEGKKVSEIFDQSGEPYFRQLETALLSKLAQESLSQKLVLATGGGVLVTPGNLELLSSFGRVVCLMAAPATLATRLAQDKDRPLLAGAKTKSSLLIRLSALLEARAEAYAACTHHVDTNNLSPDEVSQKIMALLATSNSSRLS